MQAPLIPMKVFALPPQIHKILALTFLHANSVPPSIITKVFYTLHVSISSSLLLYMIKNMDINDKYCRHSTSPTDWLKWTSRSKTFSRDGTQVFTDIRFPLRLWKWSPRDDEGTIDKIDRGFEISTQ